MSLQRKFPANHCTVHVHIVSTHRQANVTKRSATAMWKISLWTVDLTNNLFCLRMLMTVAVLPRKESTAMAANTTALTSVSWVNWGACSVIFLDEDWLTAWGGDKEEKLTWRGHSDRLFLVLVPTGGKLVEEESVMMLETSSETFAFEKTKVWFNIKRAMSEHEGKLFTVSPPDGIAGDEVSCSVRRWTNTDTSLTDNTRFHCSSWRIAY